MYLLVSIILSQLDFRLLCHRPILVSDDLFLKLLEIDEAKELFRRGRVDSLILFEILCEIGVKMVDFLIRVCLLEVGLYNLVQNVHIFLMDIGMLKLVLFDVILKLRRILREESVLVISKLGVLDQCADRVEDLDVFIVGSFHGLFISFLKILIIELFCQIIQE